MFYDAVDAVPFNVPELQLAHRQASELAGRHLSSCAIDGKPKTYLSTPSTQGICDMCGA